MYFANYTSTCEKPFGFTAVKSSATIFGWIWWNHDKFTPVWEQHVIEQHVSYVTVSSWIWLRSFMDCDDWYFPCCQTLKVCPVRAGSHKLITVLTKKCRCVWSKVEWNWTKGMRFDMCHGSWRDLDENSRQNGTENKWPLSRFQILFDETSRQNHEERFKKGTVCIICYFAPANCLLVSVFRRISRENAAPLVNTAICLITAACMLMDFNWNNPDETYCCFVKVS